MTKNPNAYLPLDVEIVERVQEAPDIFTWKLKFTDPQIASDYRFQHGQFNMLYLYGVGEVPISIMSSDGEFLLHTIRNVGRVTNGMANLKVGDHIGLRGPYGEGWPMESSKGKDIVFVTGGLGCAPVVSAIKHVVSHRDDYGKLVIMQAVRHRHDLLWAAQYEEWRQVPDTQVLLASSEDKTHWPNWKLGLVTELFGDADFNAENAVVMSCGPDGMMSAIAKILSQDHSINKNDIYLSLERNMQCAIGHCGHCQYQDKFICKDGPVFSYEKIEHTMKLKGF